MQSNQLWRRLAIATFAVGVLVSINLIVADRGAGVHAKDAALLCKSAALYSALTHGGSPAQISNSQCDIYSVGGAAVSQMQVEVGPGDGATSTVMNWDRATGDLLRIRRPSSDHGIAAQPVMEIPQAARASEGWLRRLGIAKRSAAWRLARDPVHDYKRAYSILWISGTLRARLVVEDRTGDLFQADIVRRSSPR